MAQVQVTNHLLRFFPALNGAETDVEGATVAEVIAAMDARHKGFADYLLDETGALRKHVNVFVEDELIHDRARLTDPVGPDTRIFILQALSGG